MKDITLSRLADEFAVGWVNLVGHAFGHIPAGRGGHGHSQGSLESGQTIKRHAAAIVQDSQYGGCRRIIFFLSGPQAANLP